MAFERAIKRAMKGRMAMEGPPGSGKTYTALVLATEMVGPNGRIAVIDTERGSARKYADEFTFDVVELDAFAPSTFAELIREAEAGGYDALVIDSLSHAWMGSEGMLEQVDKIAKRKNYGSNFAAWKDASPQERAMWDTLLGCNMHVFATLRTKTDYVMEEQVGRDGKTRSVPKRVGLAPIQRDGLDYEFDLVAQIDQDHNLSVTKTRCRALDGYVVNKAGKEMARKFKTWLDGGVREEPKADPRVKELWHEAKAILGADAAVKAMLKARGVTDKADVTVEALEALLVQLRKAGLSVENGGLADAVEDINKRHDGVREVLNELADSTQVNDTAESADLADDPDVVRAFEQLGLSKAMQDGLLNSAREHGWSIGKLLEMIFAKSQHGGGAPARGNGKSVRTVEAEPVDDAGADFEEVPTGNERFVKLERRDRPTSDAKPAPAAARPATATRPAAAQGRANGNGSDRKPQTTPQADASDLDDF